VLKNQRETCLIVASIAFTILVITSRPSLIRGEESLELFNKEIQAAEKAPHRDAKVEHLRKALSYRPNHPDNIVIEYRIGIELSQREDPKFREALAIFENIVERYDHMDYYEMEGPDTIYSPQAMVAHAHTLAASLHRMLYKDSTKAREHLWRAMECMKQTYERRKEDWLNLPPPPRPREDSPFGGPREMSKWKYRMDFWKQRKEEAAAGNVFSRDEVLYAEAAVRQYGYSFGPHKPEMVPVDMNEIIRHFPDTPMARIAQGHIDRISETMREKILEEPILDDKVIMAPSVEKAEEEPSVEAKLVETETEKTLEVGEEQPAAGKTEVSRQITTYIWVSVIAAVAIVIVLYLAFSRRRRSEQ